MDINNQLRESLQGVGVIGDLGNLVKLDFTNIWSGYAENKAKELVNYMVEVIPNEILRELFQSTSGNNAPIIKINFYDQKRSFSGADDFHGRYTPWNREIDINITDIFRVDTDRECYHRRTMIHEIGHAIDLELLKQDQLPLSRSTEFTDLFERENKNLTEETSLPYDDQLYGQTDSYEYFAEVFSAMYSTNENFKRLIWEQVPETCKYIESKITEYINMQET